MLGISAVLLVVFTLLGVLTYNHFYFMLEDREEELLHVRVERFAEHLTNLIDRFKDETGGFYPARDQLRGNYDYFLPENVHDPNSQQFLHEKIELESIMSQLLRRNHNATAIMLYRIHDKRLFYFSDNPQVRIRAGFQAAPFFDDLPLDYAFPYIGAWDDADSPTGSAMLYFVNPLFDFSKMHYERPVGYFLMLLDHNELIDFFDPEVSAHTHLLILHHGQILLDQYPFKESEAAEQLTQSRQLKEYGLEIRAHKSKASIQQTLSGYMLIVSGLLLVTWAMCMGFIYVLHRVLIIKLQKLSQHFKLVQNDPFQAPVRVKGRDEISDLMRNFNVMTGQLQEYIKQHYVLELQKKHAEYQFLKMQINPHFLYNTLESFRMQALSAMQTQLADNLFALGRLLRWILKADRDRIPIHEELRYTEYYLELLTLGKDNLIELHVYHSEPITNLYILKFSLQPIVENAIEHGQLEQQRKPSISIFIQKKVGELHIEILNNGKGLDAGEQKLLQQRLDAPEIQISERLGLKNVHDRIRTYFGDPYGLTVLSMDEEEGFGLMMRLPDQTTYTEV